MNREQAQVHGGAVSVIVNVLLFIIKLAAGILTGSIALIADAWHTMSDSLSSVAVIAAAKLAARKPDKEHPFGHGRWEQIVSIFIAFALTIIAYEFSMSSIQRFREKTSVDYGMLAVIVTVVSIIVKEVLTRYTLRLAKKTASAALKADAWHHRSDALSSAVILIGIVFAKVFPKLWWMDGVLGLICALMLFCAAIQIMRETISKLLGEEDLDGLKDEISEEARKLFGKDLYLHHFHIHNYVTQKEVTFHVVLDRNMTISEGHRISEEMSNMINEKFGVTATIHIDPDDQDRQLFQ